jgi:hypothetical protein
MVNINAGNVLTALAAILGTERLLLGHLRAVDPDALYREIQANRPLPPEPFLVLAPFYRNDSESFEAHYSMEYILKKLREARPDLWTLLTSCPGGVEWLAARRAEIMEQLK